ncbi:hypothetical protein CAPTEDRAFT_228056 [Capitella teleta]|uniref:G-protein coupled receptor GRL101 n=1 Tax=Capitella teleta TaxID=283909 RepID=R7TGK1_CAPTE|nr:hypothetical protein CAPTEDRAFT_228056 [Capitella teleta]|eukprot:ELT92799.1 hypothetical protein CAPTEDRAFT_228056 [Capitella teleta]
MVGRKFKISVTFMRTELFNSSCNLSRGFFSRSRETGTIRDRDRTGGAEVINWRQNKAIRISDLRNRFLPQHLQPSKINRSITRPPPLKDLDPRFDVTISKDHPTKPEPTQVEGDDYLLPIITISFETKKKRKSKRKTADLFPDDSHSGVGCRRQGIHHSSMWSLYICLMTLLVSGCSCESIEVEMDKDWYTSENIPTVDLEAVVANLSQKYTWFKYIGNTTLECSNLAKQMPTLMMAIEQLHDCLMRHYQECASEFANQTGCEAPEYSAKPCGTVRMGYKGVAPSVTYEPFMDCVWYLEVPDGFFVNLTIDEFYLESSNLNCTYDWVTIHDGYDDNATVYGRYCGRLDKFTIYGTSRYMMIKAHSDGEIGKKGFRAVYQVVDPGIAETYSEIVRYRYVNSGEFTLSESPVTKLETYLDSYYYNEWHVRVDFSRRIRMTLSFLGVDGNDTTNVYDGPWVMSHLLEVLYHRSVDGEMVPMKKTVVSTGFQLFLVLRRSQLTEKGQYGTDLNCSWTSELVPTEDLLQRTVSNEDCMGPPELILDEEAAMGVTIGLPKTAKLKQDKRAIICAWKIHVPKNFIQMSIKTFEVNGPNYDDCLYEGLLVVNSGNFFNKNGSEEERIGPFCSDEPKGIFSPTRRGAHKITSTGRTLLIIYYSYVEYPYHNISQERGDFKAELYSTECQGFWQICTRPTYDSFSLPTNFFDISVDDNADRRTRNLTFSCFKSKCCVLQEFPIYRRASFDRCDIELRRDGPTILATSKFITRIVVPYKVSESHIQYSREIPYSFEHFEKPGPLVEEWLGTRVFVSYQSVSVRASGAFTMSIEPSRCGSFKPNIHADSMLFPPCAKAKLPVTSGTYQMTYLDPRTSRGKFYTFNAYYAQPDCGNSGCFTDQMEIKKDLSSLSWTNLPTLPMKFSTWGMDTDHQNWSRLITVHRQKNCEDYMGDCYLYINFKEEQETEWDSEEELSEIDCPHGYDKVHDSCYKVIWTSDSFGSVLNLSENAITFEDAQRKCEEHNGNLVKIDSKLELKRIKLKSFYTWWSRFLRFIPGSKSYFLGLRKQGRNFRWIDDTPVTYMNWGVPGNFKRRPDKARSSLDWSKSFDAVYSPLIRQSANHINPPVLAGWDCAVMNFDTFTSPFYWYSIPCDQSIEGTLPLCEAPPLVPPATQYNTRTLGAKLRTSKEKGITNLELPNYECDLPYFLLDNKCFYLGKASTVTRKKTPPNDCRNPIIDGQGAVITDDLFPLLAQILDNLVKDQTIWGIRVATNPNLSEDNTQKHTWKIVSEHVENCLSNNTEWVLSRILSDNEEASKYNLFGFMCQKSPNIPLDNCGPHQTSCDDKTCILADQRCDGIINCNDETDENACSVEDICEADSSLQSSGTLEYCFKECLGPSCVCNELYFQCRLGGCIPLSKLCNYAVDCPRDQSDEEFCNKPPCKTDEAQCDSGQCYDAEKRCDYFNDCIDGSDEHNCSFTETCKSNKGILCNNGTCIPSTKINDLIPDCSGLTPLDELKLSSAFGLADYSTEVIIHKPNKQTPCLQGEVRCTAYVGQCIDRALTCVYDIDKFGDLAHCRTGSHLANCAQMNCGGLFKCPNSYCLPIKRVCDHHIDCPNGEDEESCENYACPGKACHYHYFYLITHLYCKDYFVVATKRIASDKTRHNLMEVIPPEIAGYTQLYRLDLSYNLLSSITDKYFKKLSVLKELYLHNNKIGGFSENNFIGLSGLTTLTLQDNRISHVSEGAFEGLTALTDLDLSHQEIRSLEGYYLSGLDNIEKVNMSYNQIETLKNFSFSNRMFSGAKNPIYFKKLKSVDIRGNRVTKIEDASFVYFPTNTTLYTDKFLLCCYAEHISDCYPRPDEFSSCYNLIRDPKLRLIVWILGLLASVGNLIILQQRTKYENETTPSLLLQHLSFADLLMGIYLMIVVSADQYYRDNYILQADKWRASAICKLAGFLQISSCEMSTFLIMLLALDRVYNLVPGCMSHGIGVRGVRGFIALGWTAATLSSVAPILEFRYFGQDDMGFVRTGTCTTYNIIKGKTQSGWEFSMALFVIFNFICYLVTCVGFIRAMKAWMKGVDPTLPEFRLPEDLMDATDEDKELAREDELIYRENEMIITRRLFLVISTNFLIWLPLIVVGAMALWGYHVSTSFSAWISIFIVPLNAAINPYLYTFTVNPFRPPTDDLLRNWIEVDFDEDDEFTTRTMKDSQTAVTARTDLPSSIKSETA